MFIISFPRSGEELTVRLLNHIYNYYNLKFSHCNYYNCCQQIPCKENKCFQKNHDFNLDLHLDKNEKFIVLFRKNKITQFESYFRFIFLNEQSKDNANINYNEHTIFNKLINFMNTHSIYYDNFVSKYIINKYPYSFVIEYSDLIYNPKKYIRGLIYYLNLSSNNNVDISTDIQTIYDTFEKIEYKNRLNIVYYNKIYKHFYSVKLKNNKKQLNFL